MKHKKHYSSHTLWVKFKSVSISSERHLVQVHSNERHIEDYRHARYAKQGDAVGAALQEVGNADMKSYCQRTYILSLVCVDFIRLSISIPLFWILKIRIITDVAVIIPLYRASASPVHRFRTTKLVSNSQLSRFFATFKNSKKVRGMPPKKAAVPEKILLGRPSNNLKMACNSSPLFWMLMFGWWHWVATTCHVDDQEYQTWDDLRTLANLDLQK